MALPLGAAVPSLTRWGLSSDADLVFRTVTTFGPRTARVLAGELGLTRVRVESAVAELREHGAVVPVADPTLGADRRIPAWAPRPAAEVIHEVRARRLRIVDRATMARQHHGVTDVLNSRLTGAGIPVRPALGGTISEHVRHLPNLVQSRRRLAELMRQEQHDHLVINTELVDNAATRSAQPITRSTYDNTVRYRVLGRPPVDGDHAGHSQVIDRSRFFYRQAPDTPLKLFICDRRVALFPVDPLDFERGYLEVSHPEVVAALITLFDRHWEAGVDPREHAVAAIALSARERDLIGLLALGHTDVTAAQELRISARSVTNVLRALMDRVGVENRFQLGLALGALEVAVPPALEIVTAAVPPAPASLPLAS